MIIKRYHKWYFACLLLDICLALATEKCQMTCLHQRNIHRRSRYDTFYCRWVGTEGQKPLAGCVALDNDLMANITTDYDKCPKLKNCFQPHNFTVRSDVSFYGVGIQRMSSDFLTDFPKLQKLIIFNNSISSIGTNAFKKSQLRYVDLNINKISQITTHFQNLTTLNVLDLRQNLLSWLPADAFEGIKKLSSLFLWGNRLKTLDFLPDLVHIQSLNLELDESFEIRLEEFPFFANLKNLQLVCHEPVNLSHLTGSHEKLKRILVKGIASINETFFFNMPNLQGVRLSNGHLKGISERLVSHLFCLETIRMENLGLTFVESGAFRNSRSLRSLSLRQNQLTELNGETFIGLGKLTYLDLSLNHLVKIDSFSHLTKIKMLNLSFNELSQINESAFLNVSDLQYLNLEGNSLSNLKLPLMRSLNILILDNNSFPTLPIGLMKKLTGLEKISILYNPLKRIHGYSFKHAQITDISFGCCSDHSTKASDIPQCFNRSKIYIDETTFKLQTLFSTNREMRQIRMLGCCERLFGGYLYLKTNKFIARWNHKYWGTTIGSLRLKNVGNDALIDLSGNGLRKICFRQFPDLTAKLLDLSNNEILTINSNAFIDSKISIINLSGNRIKTFSLLLNQRISDMFQSISAKNCYIQSFSISSKNDAGSQFLKIDLSYNFLESVGNIKLIGFERYGIINISHNRLKRLPSSATIFNGSLIDTLDISHNELEEMPEKIKNMKHTTFKADNNRWDCFNCSNVNLMEYAKKYMNVFGYDCYGNISRDSIYEECLIEEEYIPYSFLALTLLFALMKLAHSINLIRLKKKYRAYQKVFLKSFQARKKFELKSTLHQKLNHPNIILLHGFGSEINLKRFLTGFLFIETPHCSLREVLIMSKKNQITLNEDDLCWQLINAVYYLHLQSPHVYHLGLCLDSIYLIEKPSGWILKVGNFLNSESVGFRDECYELKDLYDVSILISEMRTTQTIEFDVLVSSLRQGLPASNALECPAFSTLSNRIFKIQQLSQTLNLWSQMSPKEQKKQIGIELLELNSSLVIGGTGAWNVHFSQELLDKFGCHGRGYKVTKYSDLIRFVRNVIVHAKEQPNLMLKIFDSTSPTEETFYDFFMQLFPYFYLHSLLIYEKTVNPGTYDKDLYLQEYVKLETQAQETGLRQGTIRTLSSSSSVYIKLFYFHPETLRLSMAPNTLTFEQDEPNLKINGSDVVKKIWQDLRAYWPGVSIENILAKNFRGENLLDKRSKPKSEGKNDKQVNQGIPVLEGSTVEIAKMEALIQSASLPTKDAGWKYLWEFSVKSNVGDLKKAFIERLKDFGIRAIDYKDLEVWHKGQTLKDADVILKLEFYKNAFDVESLEKETNDSSCNGWNTTFASA